MPRARRLLAALAAISITAASAPSLAAPPSARDRPAAATAIVLLPTAVADGDRLRAARADEGDLGRLAQSLDALLAETAEDLGLSALPPPPGAGAHGARTQVEADLIQQARGADRPVLLPSLRRVAPDTVELHLALALPGGAKVIAGHERIKDEDLPVRAVVMLRDLAAHLRRAPDKPLPRAPRTIEPALAGRITLMASSTAFGGFIGYSIQRASGSNDWRLIVPLSLAGAGIGLGASFIASGEWDVTPSDAWFFTAGIMWPTLAGHLVFQGRFSDTRSDRDRWVFGLLGGGVGGGIAVLGLALRPISERGAIVAHAGGGLGVGLGALVEMAARRDTHHVPYAGMGYGAGLGWLAAAAVAVHLRGAPRPHPPEKPGPVGVPFAGVLGESEIGALREPIFGVGYKGSLEALMERFPR